MVQECQGSGRLVCHHQSKGAILLKLELGRIVGCGAASVNVLAAKNGQRGW